MSIILIIFIWLALLLPLAFYSMVHLCSFQDYKGSYFLSSSWGISTALLGTLASLRFWGYWIEEGVWAGLSFSLATAILLFLGLWGALRLGEYAAAGSTSNIFHHLYGYYVGKIAVFWSLLASWAALTWQLRIAVNWWHDWVPATHFLGSSSSALAFLVALLALHVVMGGAHSLWLLHLLQWLVAVACLPLIGLALYHYGAPASRVDFNSSGWHKEAFLQGMLWAALPVFWERSLWKKHSFHIRKSFGRTLIKWAILVFFIAALAKIGAYGHHPSTLSLMDFVEKVPGLKSGLLGGFLVTFLTSAGAHLHHLILLSAEQLVPYKSKYSSLQFARLYGFLWLLLAVLAVGFLPKLPLVSALQYILLLYWGVLLVPLMAAIIGWHTSSFLIYSGMAVALGGIFILPLVMPYPACSQEKLLALQMTSSFLLFVCLLLISSFFKGDIPLKEDRASFWASWALKQSQWQKWQRIKATFQAWWDAHSWWISFPWRSKTYVLGGLYGVSFMGWVIGSMRIEGIEGKAPVGILLSSSWILFLSVYASLVGASILVAFPFYGKHVTHRKLFLERTIRWAINHILFFQPMILLLWSGGQREAWIFWLGSLFIGLRYLHPAGLAVLAGLNSLLVVGLSYWWAPLRPFDWKAMGKELGYFETAMSLLLFFLWMRQQRRKSLKEHQVDHLQNAYELSTYALQDAEDAHFNLMQRLQEEVFWPLSRVDNSLEESKSKAKRSLISKHHVTKMQGELKKGMQALESLTMEWKKGAIYLETSDLPILLAQWKEHAEYRYQELVLVIHNVAKVPIINVDKRYFFELLDTLLHLAYQPSDAKEQPLVLCVKDVFLEEVSVVTPPVPALGFAILPAKIAATQPFVGSYDFGRHVAVLEDLAHRGGLLYRALDHVYAHYGCIVKNQGDSYYRIILPITPKSIQPLSSFPKRELPLFSQQALAAAWHAENHFRAAIEKGKYHFDQIQQAITFAKMHHAHQKRHSGEPYYVHLWEVAEQVIRYSSKEEVLLATILHDTLDDTYMNLVEIYLLFGKRVAILVDQVTRLHSGRRKIRLDPLYLPPHFLKNLDKEAVLIKLCDRWHNLRTLSSIPAPKRKQIILETEKVYLDLAKQYGYRKLGNELKSLVAAYHKAKKNAS